MKNGILKANVALLASVALLPSLAFAHTGTGAQGMFAGFGHPLGGLDHMLAMVAVGIWAAQMGGRAVFTLPLTFVAVMIMGGLMGIAGIALPYVEGGILASVIVMGVVIAAAMKFPAILSTMLVAVFAVFHGHAHGTEMPLASSAIAYGAGFAIATALLHGTGIALGQGFKSFNAVFASRLAGAIIASAGTVLALG